MKIFRKLTESDVLAVLAALSLAVMLLLAPSSAMAANQNVLTWVDNATNEASQGVERTVVPAIANCVATATGFTEIAVVGMNITTFSDTAVSEGVTYCYRVRASNTAGNSAYSNTAGRTIPFTVPLAPSGLTAN
jgi:hypothetical protein